MATLACAKPALPTIWPHVARVKRFDRVQQSSSVSPFPLPSVGKPVSVLMSVGFETPCTFVRRTDPSGYCNPMIQLHDAVACPLVRAQGSD
jgi:hypothetical protein